MLFKIACKIMYYTTEIIDNSIQGAHQVNKTRENYWTARMESSGTKTQKKTDITNCCELKFRLKIVIHKCT